MLLFTHISLSLISILYSLFVIIKPSQSRINKIYILTASSIISGLGLIIVSPQSIGVFCISSILYLTFVIVMTHISKKRILLQVQN